VIWAQTQWGQVILNLARAEVRVGIELDTPLSKVRERNRYQASLIMYQQSRRQYLSFVDNILRSLRQHARMSKLYQLNFELSRAACSWSYCSS
jgi:hypothetical protein